MRSCRSNVLMLYLCNRKHGHNNKKENGDIWLLFLLYTLSTPCWGRQAECVCCRVRILFFGQTFFFSMYFFVRDQTACVTLIIIQCASIPAGSCPQGQGPSHATTGPHHVPSCTMEITLCLQRHCQKCCTLPNIKVI